MLSWQHGRHSLKFGGSYRDYIWPMWGFFQNRGYYQFTNGFTTQTATNDGTGSALASFLLGLPAVKQRQAGIPQMQLRQWYVDGFAQDSFQLTHSTTIEIGLRYEYMNPSGGHHLSEFKPDLRQWNSFCVHWRAEWLSPRSEISEYPQLRATFWYFAGDSQGSGWWCIRRSAFSLRRWI